VTASKLGDIRVSVADGVAELTLDRPDDNALTLTTASELTQFLVSLRTGTTIRALLLTAKGRRFCVGADMQGDAGRAPAQPLEHRYAYEAYTLLFDTMWQLELPMVTAVNGTVAGAGWLLALLADLVVADENARWTHAFARRALLPHAGDPYYLTRVVPFRRLMEISLLSDPVTSTTLERWNVVNLAVPAEDVLATARQLAQLVKWSSTPARSTPESWPKASSGASS